jgi:transcriptional regulatory protein LevR
MKDIEYYKNVEKEINNILFKNPTAFSLSRDILKKIYIYYFTTIPNIKIDVLSLSIKNFVLGIKIDDEKANKLLNTIITS